MSAQSPLIYTKKSKKRQYNNNSIPLTPIQHQHHQQSTPQSPIIIKKSTHKHSTLPSHIQQSQNTARLHNIDKYIWKANFTDTCDQTTIQILNQSIINHHYSQIFKINKTCDKHTSSDICGQFIHRFFLLPNMNPQPIYYHCNICIYIVLDHLFKIPITQISYIVHKMDSHQILDLHNTIRYDTKQMRAGNKSNTPLLRRQLIKQINWLIYKDSIFHH